MENPRGSKRDFFEIKDGDGQNGNGDEPELRKHVGVAEGFIGALPGG
jgi:hypothetical protein